MAPSSGQAPLICKTEAVSPTLQMRSFAPTTKTQSGFGGLIQVDTDTLFQIETRFRSRRENWRIALITA